MAGYYRRFVPNYSDLSDLLTDLTKKAAPDLVQWSGQYQQAFTQIKAALCGGPFLHSPEFSLPFLLQTDKTGGLERSCPRRKRVRSGWCSTSVIKLSKREKMYSTIEKECLAIRRAVLTLRYYLLGRKFTLCSETGDERCVSGSSANDKHLCLISVIGVERLDKSHWKRRLSRERLTGKWNPGLSVIMFHTAL